MLICCLSLCLFGTDVDRTAERIWLKVCTRTEVCPGHCVLHFDGDCPGVPPGKPKMLSSEVNFGSHNFENGLLDSFSIYTTPGQLSFERSSQKSYACDENASLPLIYFFKIINYFLSGNN